MHNCRDVHCRSMVKNLFKRHIKKLLSWSFYYYWPDLNPLFSIVISNLSLNVYIKPCKWTVLELCLYIIALFSHHNVFSLEMTELKWLVSKTTLNFWKMRCVLFVYFSLAWAYYSGFRKRKARVRKCNRFPRQKGGHGPRRFMRRLRKLGMRLRQLVLTMLWSNALAIRNSSDRYGVLGHYRVLV